MPVQSSRGASHSQGGDRRQGELLELRVVLCEKFIPLLQREQPLRPLWCLSDSSGPGFE